MGQYSWLRYQPKRRILIVTKTIFSSFQFIVVFFHLLYSIFVLWSEIICTITLQYKHETVLKRSNSYAVHNRCKLSRSDYLMYLVLIAFYYKAMIDTILISIFALCASSLTSLGSKHFP